MRLIDADALVAKIWEEHKKTEDTYDLCVDEVKDILCGIVSLIDEQPTAYNLDKVVEQLDTYITKVGQKKFRTISDSYADRERWWSRWLILADSIGV